VQHRPNRSIDKYYMPLELSNYRPSKPFDFGKNGFTGSSEAPSSFALALRYFIEGSDYLRSIGYTLLQAAWEEVEKGAADAAAHWRRNHHDFGNMNCRVPFLKQRREAKYTPGPEEDAEARSDLKSCRSTVML